MSELGDTKLRAERAITALRPEPAAVFRGVPGTVREGLADVLVDLLADIERLEQRQRDINWLQISAFQLLKERGVLPSSRELIDAHTRARAALDKATT